MVRTTLIPERQDVSIHVPESYVGRKVEILLFPLDEELSEVPTKGNSIKDLRGSLKLTDRESDELLRYLKDIRGEWNTDI